MRVLVTGASGFLGGRLTRALLARGDEVTVAQRSAVPALEELGARVVRGDLATPQVAEAAVHGQEVVFHVAAKPGIWGPEADYERANLTATEQLLTAAKAAGVARFVYTSTPSVVFSRDGHAGADESAPYGEDFLTAYPRTKAIAERAVLAAHAPGHFATVALRPHLIWGVGDPHLVPRIVQRARTGRLRIIGDGTNRVDLTHVDNAVAAHLAAEKALRQEEFARRTEALAARTGPQAPNSVDTARTRNDSEPVGQPPEPNRPRGVVAEDRLEPGPPVQPAPQRPADEPAGQRARHQPRDQAPVAEPRADQTNDEPPAAGRDPQLTFGFPEATPETTRRPGTTPPPTRQAADPTGTGQPAIPRQEQTPDPLGPGAAIPGNEDAAPAATTVGGHAYFISDGDPVVLWDWVNDLLARLDLPTVRRTVSPRVAYTAGATAEALWRTLRLPGEPPMTRFVALQLATDHWFDITAARTRLGYTPTVDLPAAKEAVVRALRG